MPKGPAAEDLSLDFFALLLLEKGVWTLLLWGFAGDIGPKDEARMKYPQIPKELIHQIPAE